MTQGTTGELEDIYFDIPEDTASISVSTFPAGGFFEFRILETYENPSSKVDKWKQFIKDTVGSAGGGLADERPTFLALSKPEILRLDLVGDLPTDKVNMTPKRLKATVSDRNNILFKCGVELSLQGRSSLNHLQNGYTLDLFTEDFEDSLEVKWGDWYAKDSWHLKGFWGDELKTLDVSAGRFYEQMYKARPFPSSYNSPFSVPSVESSSKYKYQSEAKFYTDGIPCEVFHNGEWLGLWVWRMKKDRANYRTVKGDPTHLHLESFDGNTFIHTWNPAQWEIRNGEPSGYVPGGPVSDTYINNTMNTFTSWVSNCWSNSSLFATTYQDHLGDLLNWIDYLLLLEAFYGIDGLINNYQLIMFNQKAWVYPYDFDYLFGIRFAVPPNNNYTNRVISVFDNRLLRVIDRDAQTQVRARYKELRDKGIFSVNNVIETFGEIPAILGEPLLKKQFDKWGSFQYTNFGLRLTIPWIANSFNNRLNYLDGVFAYTPG